MSYQMFGHMYGVLNMDKIKKSIAQFACKLRDELLSLIVSWFDNMMLQQIFANDGLISLKELIS